MQIAYPTLSPSSDKFWEQAQCGEWMYLFKIVALTEAHYCFLLNTLGGSYCQPVSGGTCRQPDTAVIINTWKIPESLFSFYSFFPRKNAAEVWKSEPQGNEDLLPSSRIHWWKEKPPTREFSKLTHSEPTACSDCEEDLLFFFSFPFNLTLNEKGLKGLFYLTYLLQLCMERQMKKQVLAM